MYIFFPPTQEPEEAAPEIPATPAPEKVDAATQTPVQPARVLMVEVENVTHDKFQITEEVKVSFRWLPYVVYFFLLSVTLIYQYQHLFQWLALISSLLLKWILHRDRFLK